MDDDNTRTRSIVQLNDDFKELVFLCQKPLKLLLKFGLKSKTYDELMSRLLRIIRLAKSTPTRRESIDHRIGQKHLLKRELRKLYRLIPAFVMADEWQSPGYMATTLNAVGPLTGRVEAGLYDYKRDHHRHARIYEEKFTREYVGRSLLKPMASLVTNSGMSAATTIMTYLRQNQVETVLVGRHSYFQFKALIHSLFIKVVEFDETDTTDLVSKLHHNRPQAVLFDSLTNDGSLTVLNSQTLIDCIHQFSHQVYIVIDNVVGAINLPIAKLMSKHYSRPIIAFESLNKFHQYGFDLITGGIIYAKSSIVSKLFSIRKDCGSILDDLPTLTLPEPSRKYMQLRLHRLCRNAAFFARALSQNIRPSSKIQTILYQEPSHDTVGAPFVNFVFKPKYQNIKSYQAFCRKIFSRCQSQDIELVGGTSFGLDTSRLYITALRSTTTRPFVRFSPGTETAIELKQLVAAFDGVINS